MFGPPIRFPPGGPQRGRTFRDLRSSPTQCIPATFKSCTVQKSHQPEGQPHRHDRPRIHARCCAHPVQGDRPERDERAPASKSTRRAETTILRGTKFTFGVRGQSLTRACNTRHPRVENPSAQHLCRSTTPAAHVPSTEGSTSARPYFSESLSQSLRAQPVEHLTKQGRAVPGLSPQGTSPQVDRRALRARCDQRRPVFQ